MDFLDLTRIYEAPCPAAVLAHGTLADPHCKTAHGVLLHSTLFEVRCVINEESAGKTVDQVLFWIPRRVPIVASVDEALRYRPSVLIVGVATEGGRLPPAWEGDIEAGLGAGLDLISGLHRFLEDDPRLRAMAEKGGARIFDLRRPPERLRIFDGRIEQVAARVVTVMGTDAAVGKRTAAVELARAAAREGIKAGFVATGQTGMMIGADRGAAIDAIPADFGSGVVEEMVCQVAGEGKELILVEGQGALTHLAYGGVALAILQGSRPDAVVVVHDPLREARVGFGFPMATLEQEIDLIEELGRTRVVAVASSAEGVHRLRGRTSFPVGNVRDPDGLKTLLRAVLEAVGL